MYATGYTYNAVGNADYTTIKYNSIGTEQWVANFDGQENLDDAAFSLALDNTGNVVVTGSAYSSSNLFDFATVKYDNNGVQQWAQYFDAGYGKDEIALAVKTDNIGNIFITGNSGLFLL